MLAVIRGLLWLGIAFATFCAAIGALSANATRDGDTAAVFGVAFVFGLVLMYWLRAWLLTGLSKKDVSARQKLLDDFQASNGFNCDKALIGSISILFDTKAQRMAFFDGDSVVEHPYSYIRSWEQRWKYRGEKTYEHRIHFQLNNLDRPTLTVIPGSGWASGDRGPADQWDATLGLILSGGPR